MVPVHAAVLQDRIKNFEMRAVKAGFLTKQGHKFKNWKRRWFVLRGRMLSYYRKPTDVTPAGTACSALTLILWFCCMLLLLLAVNVAIVVVPVAVVVD